MTRREEVLVQLLERLAEFVDPMQARGGVGDGVSVPLMPDTYTASVREVERLLRVMREDRSAPLVVLESGEKASVRRLWWHVRAWYVDVDRAPVAVVRVRVPRGRRRELRRLPVDASGRPLPARREVRDPRARRLLAEAGVAWLAGHWALGQEPMMPVLHGRECRCTVCRAELKAAA